MYHGQLGECCFEVHVRGFTRDGSTVGGSIVVSQLVMKGVIRLRSIRCQGLRATCFKVLRGGD